MLISKENQIKVSYRCHIDDKAEPIEGIIIE